VWILVDYHALNSPRDPNPPRVLAADRRTACGSHFPGSNETHEAARLAAPQYRVYLPTAGKGVNTYENRFLICGHDCCGCGDVWGRPVEAGPGDGLIGPGSGRYPLAGASGLHRLSLLPVRCRASGPDGLAAPVSLAGPACARSAWPGRVFAARSSRPRSSRRYERWAAMSGCA
jgi:hypothetical protein